MKETYKDTDLREALKRKYADTPQLPADFITKMQEETLTHSLPNRERRKSVLRWIAAAACLLIILGVGINYMFFRITDVPSQNVTRSESMMAHQQRQLLMKKRCLQAVRSLRTNSPEATDWLFAVCKRNSS